MNNNYTNLKVFIVFFFLLITFINNSVFANDELETAEIIDWHVHVAGLGYGDSSNFINDTMDGCDRKRVATTW